MGSQLDDNSSETSQSVKTYLHELFTLALSIGMTYEQYWDDDVELINDYIKADELKQSRINSQLWLQGLYNQIAIASCLSKSAKYPKKPFETTNKEQEMNKKLKVEKLRNALKAKSKE